jgi:transcriptional regulator with XRE-family HTH domain
MTTAEKIFELMRRRGMKQKALTEMAGLAVNRLSSLKAGNGFLSGEEVFRISQALGVSADYLLDPSLADPAAPSGLTAEQARILLVAEGIGYERAWRRLTLTDEPVSAEPILVPERPARRA